MRYRAPFSSITLSIAACTWIGAAALACGDPGSADTSEESSAIIPEADMSVRELNDAERDAFMRDPRMSSAVQSAGFDDLSPNYSTSRLVTATNGLEGSETWVGLFDPRGNSAGRSLVLQEGPGAGEAFFVDDVLEQAIAAPAAIGTTRQNLFGCGSWSGWSTNSVYCGYRFWCFGQNQQGVYIQYVRTKQCRNGVHVDYKTVFQHCGC